MRVSSLRRSLALALAAVLVAALCVLHPADRASAFEPAMVHPTDGLVSGIVDQYCNQAPSRHKGIDIGAGRNGGAVIVAAAGGRVTARNDNTDGSGYGNYVVISHGGGWTTLYGHMRDASVVRVGESVGQGQLIGYVGTTGRSTGDHLHFEISRNGDRSAANLAYSCGQYVFAGQPIPVAFPGIGVGGAWSKPAKSFDQNPAADVLARRSDGTVLLHSGNGAGGIGGGSSSGTGWNSMRVVVSGGDYTSDGRNDAFGIGTDGVLYRFAGNGAGGFARASLGTGWATTRILVAGGDYTNDGLPDLLAVRADNTLWRYDGRKDGTLAPPVAMGSGWGFAHVVGGVDYDGDGNPDVIGVDFSGNMTLYPGNGAGGLRAPVGRGGGWGGLTVLMGGADYNGDGRADLLARDGGGRLLLHSGYGNGRFSSPSVVATGWQGFTAIF